MKYNITEDFPIKGVSFIDFTPSITDYETFEKVTKKLAELVPADIDGIIVPDARGFIWGATLSRELKKPMFPVRKSGKLPSDQVLTSYTYDTEYSKATLDLQKADYAGKKFVFIDDVYATGGTYDAVLNRNEEVGGTFSGGFVLFDF